MRKVLVSLALLALLAAPALSWTIGTVPNNVPGTTAPMRPEVNNGWIAAANREGSGNTGGILYDILNAAVQGNVAPTQIMNPGYWHEPQADISDNYAVFGGAPSNLSGTFGINVLRRSDNAIINIPTLDASGNEHLTSVNNAGDVVWVRWPGGAGEAIMYSNVSSGTPTAPVALVSTPAGGQGQRIRMSTDARRFAYRPENSGPGGQTMWVYDLATAQNVKVFDNTVTLDGTGRATKAFLSGIDDTGNWLVTNMRPVTLQGSEIAQSSDIWLINITNLNAPSYFPLFGNYAQVREDPRIELIDSDNALVVWNEGMNGTNANWYIRGAWLNGLASNSPNVLSVIDITAPVLGTGRRFADVDHMPNGDLVVAWLRMLSGTSADGAQIEYTIVPEPATAILLSLGVLALVRRR